jgi:predicted DNA-binding WGR domain protein/predicted RNA methylase
MKKSLYLEYSDLHKGGTSHKFYIILQNENRIQVQYGRIGSDGVTSLKEFKNISDATDFYTKMVEEKTDKGYDETHYENLEMQKYKEVYDDLDVLYWEFKGKYLGDVTVADFIGLEPSIRKILEKHSLQKFPIGVVYKLTDENYHKLNDAIEKLGLAESDPQEKGEFFEDFFNEKTEIQAAAPTSTVPNFMTMSQEEYAKHYEFLQKEMKGDWGNIEMHYDLLKKYNAPFITQFYFQVERTPKAAYALAYNAYPLMFLDKFRQAIADRFAANIPTVGRDIAALMKQFKIDDTNVAYEIAEHQWVQTYRNLMLNDGTSEAILKFYNNVQPIFAARDSNRTAMQQYSTSALVSFVANQFVLSSTGKGENLTVFEPSAGNGLLTIGFRPNQCHVNEIDKVRAAHLKMDGYNKVTTFDSSIYENMKPYFCQYDVVLSNPPFGVAPPEIDSWYDGYKVKKIDEVMALLALECMKDDGRAAIIIGGWTDYKSADYGGKSVSERKKIGKNNTKTYQDNASIAAGLPFFNYLYNKYNVLDIINIDSDVMYHKQGTTFPLRMILIAGRKTGASIEQAPKYKDNPYLIRVESSFESLWERAAQSEAIAFEIENGGFYDKTLTKNILKNALEFLQQFLNPNFEK